MLNDPAAFTVGGHLYRIRGKLNAIQQLHVVRRLAPLMSAFVGVDLAALRPDVQVDDPRASERVAQQLLGPITEGIARMTDADTEYVLGACMGVIQRELGGGTGWGPVWNVQGKVMQYDDIGFVELIQLVGRVLMDNLGDFGSALRRIGGTAAAQPQAA